jgi:hypothetical protein
MEQTFKTDYGEISVAELVRVYNVHRRANLRHQATRNLFNQTEKGKELNRLRASNYYYQHREQILQKRAEEYEKKKEEQEKTS